MDYNEVQTDPSGYWEQEISRGGPLVSPSPPFLLEGEWGFEGPFKKFLKVPLDHQSNPHLQHTYPLTLLQNKVHVCFLCL